MPGGERSVIRLMRNGSLQVFTKSNQYRYNPLFGTTRKLENKRKVFACPLVFARIEVLNNA
eukprot:1109987-Rhodomonas_salina.1